MSKKTTKVQGEKKKRKKRTPAAKPPVKAVETQPEPEQESEQEQVLFDVVEQPGKTLSEWRAARELTHITLSGLKVLYRNVTLMDVVMGGNLPPNAQAMMEELSRGTNIEIDLSNIAEAMEMIDPLIKAAWLSPKIVESEDDLDDNSMLLEEIPAEDRMYFFKCTMEGRSAKTRPLPVTEPPLSS